MATAESVKTKIQGLIDTANITTGNSDTDLTTAVNALVAGFGQGGGGASSIYMAQVTPAEDTAEIRVEHNLNSEAVAAILYANELTIDPETVANNIPVMQMYIKTNLDVYTSSSATYNAFVAGNTYSYTNGTVGRTTGYTSSAYLPAPVDLNTFKFQTSNTAAGKFKAGQTLNVLIVAASMEV